MAEKDYKKYDKICTLIHTEVFSYAIAHDNNIFIKDFNPSELDYKFILAVARNLQGVYGFNITLEVPKIKILFRKKYKGIKTAKNMEDGIDVHTLINHVFEFLEEPKDTLKDIFNEYYKGMK